MDIDLLAKMVKEVIMDHDSVTLPGVGSFVAELVPASFADKGYTIHPPYRRLYFSPKQGTDTLLADLYARSNNISEADATRILVEFLSEMKEVLKVRKTIIFPSLGRLRATRENHFFFVADEDLDIFPAGFGLAPISLKTHEETKEEVEEAVASLAEMLEAPAEEEMAGQAGHDEVPQAEPEAESEPQAELEPEPQAEPEPEPQAEPEPEPEVPELVTLADEPEAPQEPVSEPEPVPEEPEKPEEPEVIPDHEEVPEAEPQAEPEPKPEAKGNFDYTLDPELDVPAPEREHRFWKVFRWILLALAIVAVVALIGLAVVGRVAPDWLDSFLYSPEELEILHK